MRQSLVSVKSGDFALISTISADTEGRCRWHRGETSCRMILNYWHSAEWPRRSGSTGGSSADTDGADGICIWAEEEEEGDEEGDTNYELPSISILKFYFFAVGRMLKNHRWNAQTSAFLLAVRNVAHKNDDFFFGCCYNQLMLLGLWTRSLRWTVDGTRRLRHQAICLRIRSHPHPQIE